MFAGFCRFKSYETGAATDDKLQEQAIVTGRRPEKQSAYQREERGPFHDFCQRKTRALGLPSFRKSWESGQIRKTDSRRTVLSSADLNE
jgi:hypothetical protein